MKTNTRVHLAPGAEHRMPASLTPPDHTIAHTVAQHQSDPRHRFHARGQRSDARVTVAAGERLQRVRGRAQCN